MAHHAATKAKGTTIPTALRLGLSLKALRRYLLAGLGLVVAAVNVLLLWPSSSPSSFASSFSLLSLRQQSSWWEKPRGASAVSQRSSRRRRRVVMCAFDDISLRLAWTQIQALRTLTPEAAATRGSADGGIAEKVGIPPPTAAPVPVTIYHVAELNASSALLARVQALGAVQVVDLAPWLSTWTSLAFSATGQLEEQQERVYLPYYQGFLCKAAGLLHAAGAAATTTKTDTGTGSLAGDESLTRVKEAHTKNENEEAKEELVAVLDLEVVLFNDPFALAESPIFQNTGAYLFSDRRLSRGKEVTSFREYQQLITRIFDSYRQARSLPTSYTLGGLPPVLADSSIFQGWSWDYGESALLLVDVHRYASTAFFDALQYLLRVDSPTFRSCAYGDKEMYWLAVALAGELLQMNPWVPTAVGALEDHVQGTGPHHVQLQERQRVCSWANSLAQATPTHGLFYLNGEGPELSTVKGDRFLLDHGYLSAAKPFDLRERQEGLFKERNFCSTGGGVPLPDMVKARLKLYRSIYMSYNDTSAPTEIVATR